MPSFIELIEADPELKITPPDELTNITFLLHGMAGTGKTSLAATASKCEELSPVLYLDTENGTLPLRDWADEKNVHIMKILSWEQMQKTLKTMVQAHDTGGFPYKTVVVDTIDNLQELGIKFMDRVEPKNNYAKWDLAYDGFKEIFTTCAQKMGVNLICITHTSLVENEVTGEIQVAPYFHGRKSNKIMPSSFDFIGYLHTIADPEGESEEDLIRVLTTRRADLVSKQRTKTFPANIGNPTMSKFMSFILDNEETENKK